MKFLSLKKEAFGLDISDLSLKIVNLKKRGGGFNVASFNQMDLEPGIIEGGVIKNEETLIKIIKALYKNVHGRKISTKYVVASLPEEKSFMQVIQMPVMAEKDLQSAVMFEAENYIPLPINEVYLDYQLIKPMRDHLNHLDVLIVAISKKIVNSYVSCLQKAGLVPLALEVESQAITRALIKNETTESPIILVDFGKTSTIFTIFAGRSIQFTCSLAVSSDQITQAISESLKLPLDKADKIKTRYDLNSRNATEKTKRIWQIISPILHELEKQIKKYLNFYQEHPSHEHLSSKEQIEKILICGGGAGLQGLPEFLSETIGMTVTRGEFWTDITSKNNVITKQSLSYATALGLALRGVGGEEL